MRPSIDYTMLRICNVLEARSTCIKRSVGCVMVDSFGRIMATGYNGVATGQPHCNTQKLVQMHPLNPVVAQYPHACNEGKPFPSGADLCEAVHAESNALIQCDDADKIFTCYTTWSPCFRCVKELLNTGCKRIVFIQDTAEQPQAKRIWIKAGRLWLAHDMRAPEHGARSA